MTLHLWLPIGLSSEAEHLESSGQRTGIEEEDISILRLRKMLWSVDPVKSASISPQKAKWIALADVNVGKPDQVLIWGSLST